MRPALLALALLAGRWAIAGTHAAPGATFRYTTQAAGEQVIDSRPLADCLRASLPGARCLPADDFLGPHRRLPSERDLLWLFGTAGLDGSEAVLVVGQDATARDFVAGLLYLAGQRQVRILSGPMARQPGATSRGRARSMVRSAVYTAPMRAELWVLKEELRRALASDPPQLLDGRTESEYWGETVRGARGGRLPGATQRPASQMFAAPRPSLAPPGGAIAYAHDAYEGIAYFTRLVAGDAIATRVYPGGWAEWSADGSLPADAVSHPARGPERSPAAATPATKEGRPAASATPMEIAGRPETAGLPQMADPPAFRIAPLAAGAFAALGLAFAAGWRFARRRTR